ncbi:oxysterol-binding protein-related protein 2 isoform X1 [Leptopilina heterotoma]|uniref:oxysterol-binding protein-related protein 2 isoform X1 n=1 Tax=Leptopilina heterotoma TaxID=63436 RepID=UPI001CA8D090|nr:oxysterol-binding protein-related protein 2 isoform X1 [Leptopilina heterotoma]XP_043467115.1 oxysterol-binding protein-related protein 2 isoform X1 [Leptopilina heterotoma]
MDTEKYKYRTSLPAEGHSEVNLCSVLSLGKDLSKITMPVIFNEPLSFLQRVAEYMEYSNLLEKASLEPTSIGRLQYVAAFAVSALASNWNRLGKPFNPLLGETYELQHDDFRILCEQVSHHPPISAFHAESENFTFHGSINPKLKFCGKSVEIHPKGILTVKLLKWNETYTWQNVNCILHNVLVGQIWMEQLGALEIKQNGEKMLTAILNFKTAGTNGKDLHRVDGFITDENKRKLLYLYGKWTEGLRSCDPLSYEDAHEKLRRETKSPLGNSGHKRMLAKLHSLKVGAFKPVHQDAVDDSSSFEGDENSSFLDEIPESTTLWEATARPANSPDFYQFTTFAMSLNEMVPGMEKYLCPTDSRLRIDIRKLEFGDRSGAAVEKARLEEKQRDSKKLRKQKKCPDWSPRWFRTEMNPYTNQEDWIFLGNYWDRKYSEIENIF